MTPVTHAPGTVLVVGEALIDIVEEDGREREFVGGSPANTAIGLARQGHTARLLTRIGRDTRGERIAAHLTSEDVELLEDSWSSAPTSTAHARITDDGSADYRFELDWSLPQGWNPPEVHPAPVDLVHVGSIGLYLEPGGAEVLRMIRELPHTCLVTLDPNIRGTLLADRELAVQRFEDAAAEADLVKLSDEDAEWIYPGLPPAAVLAHIRALGPAIAVMTLGAQGACGLSDAGLIRIPALAVEVADTISAGDSFAASLISSMLEGGLARMTEDLGTALDRAACASAIAVSVAGANPPHREALDELCLSRPARAICAGGDACV